MLSVHTMRVKEGQKHSFGLYETRTVSQFASFCVTIRGSADLAELVFDRAMPDVDNEEVSSRFSLM